MPRPACGSVRSRPWCRSGSARSSTTPSRCTVPPASRSGRRWPTCTPRSAPCAWLTAPTRSTGSWSAAPRSLPGSRRVATPTTRRPPTCRERATPRTASSPAPDVVTGRDAASDRCHDRVVLASIDRRREESVGDQHLEREDHDDALDAARRTIITTDDRPRAAAPAAGTVRRSPLQVGAVDDPFESEADRVADDVVRALAASPPVAEAVGPESGGPDLAPPSVRRILRNVPTRASSRPAAARVQRSAIGEAGGTLDPATSAAIERRRGGGAPLGGRVRRRMEQGFGTDLAAVRLHA